MKELGGGLIADNNQEILDVYLGELYEGDMSKSALFNLCFSTDSRVYECDD